MNNIHIVGMGSLGSTIANEVAKRCLATSMYCSMHMYDFDTVETRNVANQLFDPLDVGKPKVDAVYDKLNSYSIDITKHNKRIETVNDLELDDDSVIIDAVDNLGTRTLLFQVCLVKKAPVIHAAMSANGFGNVQWNAWTVKDEFVDTWSLSPRNNHKTVEEDDRVIPPCELNSLRTLVFNTSMAAVNALFIYWGADISEFVKTSTAEVSSLGTLTSWSTGITEMNIIRELEINI